MHHISDPRRYPRYHADMPFVLLRSPPSSKHQPFMGPTTQTTSSRMIHMTTCTERTDTRLDDVAVDDASQPVFVE
jgi:hypothetical protein